jgi:hypothetical protein
MMQGRRFLRVLVGRPVAAVGHSPTYISYPAKRGVIQDSDPGAIVIPVKTGIQTLILGSCLRRNDGVYLNDAELAKSGRYRHLLFY